MACVYRITNKQNGKFYIGCTTATVEKRWSQHVRTARNKRGWLLHAALRKYGVDSFNIEVLEVVGRFDLKGNFPAITDLLIHELAHQLSDNHLDTKYHDGLSLIGAKLVELALTEPHVFAHYRNSVTA